jgi:elongation factor Ts
MVISAAQVRELRERTGAGMMECKKALKVTNGDIKLAIEELRKNAGVKADKKAGRVAANGVIVVRTTENGKQAIMLEINSETDFVARDQNFLAFADTVAVTALAAHIPDSKGLMALPIPGVAQTIEEARQALVAKVGENINVRRIGMTHPSASSIGTYVHSNRIGVLVELDCDNSELARDIAMHIAASRPLVIAPTDVPADLIAKEKEIFSAQAASSGKPAEIIEKMVNGRIQKFLDEVSLLGQPFVKDPNIQIAVLLNKNRAKVLSFTRFEVGEGIEKITEDFVEAVMSQVHGG